MVHESIGHDIPDRQGDNTLVVAMRQTIWQNILPLHSSLHAEFEHTLCIIDYNFLNSVNIKNLC